MTIHASSPSPSVAAPRMDSQPVPMRTAGGPRAYLRKVGAIVAKDLRAEVRAKEILSTMIAFSVLAVVVFGLAFDLRVPRAEMVAPGVLWVVVLFAGVLGLNRVFGAEVDRGSLSALLLAPVDRSAIYFGKLISQALFILAMEVFIVPIILVIFGVNLFNPWILAGLALGTLGYASVGTLFAALTAGTRARETMLPILLLPVMVPIFVAGVGLTANVLDGRTFAEFGRWFIILGVYDLVFVTIAFLVFDLIWEDA